MSAITKGNIAAIISAAYNQTIETNGIEIYNKSIHELIQSESFRKRTAMYIGEPTISNLESFILGYYFGESIHKFDLTLMGTHFTTFNDWVMKYYTWRESTAGWKNIILKEVGNNETEALQMFFILYDKFTAENLEAV